MILMNDFKSEPPELRAQMLAAVARVFESGWYILGTECRSFEHAWASVCGVGHGVGVANGMDAIEIALRAMDIGPGDEVITTPMTAAATVLAIERAGASPVLADIEADSGLLSLASVKRCMSERTRALVLVHLYGQIRDMNSWQDFCLESGIALLEDCAQAHTASIAGHVAGSFGRAAAFSFYPTKNLGCIGDGGMFVTNDPSIANAGRVIRNYGQSERYHHPVIGLNSRLDEIQAAILTVRLKWLHEFTAHRRHVAGLYRSGIDNPRVGMLAPPVEESAHVWHLFVVTAQSRDGLSRHLLDNDVQTLIHYPVPAHRQPPYVGARRDPQGLSVAEQHARTCLSLPCHPQMSDEDAGRVIDAVNAFKG